MDAIQCQSGLVEPVVPCQQGIVVDHGDIRSRSYPGVDPLDAQVPLHHLRGRSRHLCSQTPGRNRAHQHMDPRLMRRSQHLRVCIPGLLRNPLRCQIVGPRQNMHRLGMQRDHIRLKPRRDLDRGLPGDSLIDPSFCLEIRIGRPILRDGIPEEDHLAVGRSDAVPDTASGTGNSANPEQRYTERVQGSPHRFILGSHSSEPRRKARRRHYFRNCLRQWSGNFRYGKKQRSKFA